VRRDAADIRERDQLAGTKSFRYDRVPSRRERGLRRPRRAGLERRTNVGAGLGGQAGEQQRLGAVEAEADGRVRGDRHPLRVPSTPTSSVSPVSVSLTIAARKLASVPFSLATKSALRTFSGAECGC
jgi:hypothetical protein